MHHQILEFRCLGFFERNRRKHVADVHFADASVPVAPTTLGLMPVSGEDTFVLIRPLMFEFSRRWF